MKYCLHTQLLFYFLTASMFCNAQMVVTTQVQNNAYNVVNNTFLSSTGVMPGSLQNVTFTGLPGSLATFTGTSNIGFPEGIILGTDNSNLIPFPAWDQQEGPSYPGLYNDPQLQAIATLGIEDAAVLEFDFQPLTDTLKFRYVFASEEYPEYVCSVFNDVFGFFISGPDPAGGNYLNYNIAKVPGTNLPVAIGTINPGVVGANGTLALCQSLLHSSLYFNNSAGTGIIFDGFTYVLEAVVPVKICGTYHIKLAIGNVGDEVFNSAVFLEAYSFGGGPVPIYPTGGTNMTDSTATICPGDTLVLTGANAMQYMWSNNDTTQSINITQPGNYGCYVMDGGGCFSPSRSFQVTSSTPYAHIDPVGPFTLCPGDSVQLIANYDSAYSWSTGSNAQSIWASAAGLYSVTVTDTLGCGDTTSNVVTIIDGSSPAIIISSSGGMVLCNGQTDTLTANPGTSYLWNTGDTTQSIVVSVADTFTVTVFQTGCSNSASVITLVSNPVAAISASGPITFCQGNSVDLSANSGIGYTYLWSNGATSDTITVTASNTFTVTATDVNGCSKISQSTTVTVDTAVANITNLGNNLICQGDSIQLTANPGSNFLWSSGATTQSIYASQTNSYAVTVTNFNTCVAISSPENITVSQPVATINYAGNTTICPNTSLQLNANTGVSYTYLWSTSATTQSISAGIAGIYEVTVTNADNCKAKASLTIAVSQPLATITAIGNTTFCDGDSVQLIANNGSLFYWSNGALTQSVYITQPGSYSVTVTDTVGCSKTSLVQNVIVEYASANILFNGNTLLCPGEQNTLTASMGTGFLWNNGSTASSIIVNTNGSFNVTVTNTNGCTATSQPVSFTISQPTAIISPQGNLRVCPNETVDLQANGTNGYQWLWSDGQTTQTITVAGDATYTVTVTNTDQCSAVSDSIKTITSIPTASIIPQGSTVFCKGDQVVLEANPGIAFLWNTSATTSSITVFNGGDYYVTVTNSDTCSATSSLQSVTVNEAFATIQFTGTTNFCEGDSVMLSSSTAVLYNWSNGNTSQNIYAYESDNYYVTITDVNGCTDMSNSVPVSVYPFADIEFSLDSARACNELKVKFINTTIAEPNCIYNWSFGDGQSSASVSPVHAFDSIGVYTVVLTVTTPNNCISADSMEIILQGVPEPISKFTTEPGAGALFGTPIKFVNESQYANQYHWDFGDHTGSKEENPVHGYKDPGIYKIVLEAANDGGCKDFYEMQFSVAPFFIPSAFTPNNDGKNETFPDLNYGLNVNYFAMEIWNRWGMRIFASNNPYDTFRGKDVNGNDVPSGIYQYRFNITTGSGKPFKMEGSINLLR